MTRQKGLTIVELLISLLIVGLLLTFIAQLFRGTLIASNTTNFRNDLISEVQLAQQVIGGRLTDAVYVYKPSDGTVKLTVAGNTTKNVLGGANSGTQNWVTNTNPFVAMILPPEVPSANCTSATSPGCYRFFAYYAFPRSELLSLNGVNVTGASVKVETPSPDLTNQDRWVLMEYRRNLFNGGLSWTPAISAGGASTYYQGGYGRILADYIQPSAATGVNFTVTPPNPTATPAVVGNVRIQITGQLRRTGVDPTSSSAFSTIAAQPVTVYPRNWVCTLAAPCP